MDNKVFYKGFEIDIQQYIHAQSPDDWQDDGVFVVGWHREFFVSRDGFSKDLFGAILMPEDYPGYIDRVKQVKKEYHVFMLEAYIHSGVVLALTDKGKFPDRQWDVSSNVGAVLVAKSEAKTCTQARKLALGIVKDWNDYISGNVYGYNIEGIDYSLWGFSGDYEKSGLLESAYSEIDAHIAQTVKKHVMQRKNQIKNHVPLDKRIPLLINA